MKRLIIALMLFTTPAAAMTIDPVMALTDDKTCLKLNLYHEARGEKMRGIIEVMKVTLARLHSKQFPQSVCDVVWQQTPVTQFEWTNDHIPDNEILDKKAWQQIDMIVEMYYNNKLNIKVEPELAFYHAGPVTKFFKTLKFVKKIGNHSFYKAKKK